MHSGLRGAIQRGIQSLPFRQKRSILAAHGRIKPGHLTWGVVLAEA
jgi:hypothetical protein